MLLNSRSTTEARRTREKPWETKLESRTRVVRGSDRALENEESELCALRASVVKWAPADRALRLTSTAGKCHFYLLFNSCHRWGRQYSSILNSFTAVERVCEDQGLLSRQVF
jgi:hypothetical protein